MKRELSKIGELATYVNGYAFKPSDWSLKGRPIIRIQDLTGNDYQTNYYESTLDEKYKIKKGDLLISWSASIGIYEWDKEDAWLNQHIFKVVFDKGVDIEKKYFQFAVGNALKKVSGLIHGSTMKHLTKSAFDSIQVPLYSVDEQLKIVQRLEAMQRSVNISKKEIEKLDTLVKSRFIEMFGDPVMNPMGWEVEGLGKVCDVRDGTHDSPAYCSEGFPLVTSKNVSSGKIDLSDCSYIAKDDYEKINQRSKVDKGDIIMPMIGTVGIPVIVNFEPNFAIKNVALIKFNSSSAVNNVYIKVLLESNYFDNAIMRKVRGGTQKFISLGDIRKLQVLVPPIALQNQFAAFVAQVDKSKSVLRKLLEKQELLRAALMQEYFG